MYQLNPLFLFESKKHLMKILSRYSPEERELIRSKMLSLGKENGGWYSPQEYGERMIKGQIKRIKNFSNPKPEVHFTDVPLYKSNMTASIIKDNNGQGKLRIDAGLPRSSKSFEFPPVEGFDNPRLNKKDKKQFLRSLYQFNNKDHNGSAALSIADTYGHEADELSLGIKNWINWNNKHPDKQLALTDYMALVGNASKGKLGTHHTGVLEREAKRRHMLSQLYGRDNMFYVTRSPKEFAMNKKQITPSEYSDLFWD